MANPYHDELGKFCSRNEMRAALSRIQRIGDVEGYIKLRQEFEAIDKAGGFNPEELAKKFGSMLPKKPATNPYASQTPVDIDNQLAVIYSEYYRKYDEIEKTESYIKSYERSIERPRSNEFTLARDKAGIAKFENKKAALEAEALLILNRARPMEEEYSKRPWTRAFLVDNANGHVHKNRACSTCTPTTRFAWLPDYSGSDESKIVDDAGKSACTVCYPSAPVDVLKRESRIELPERKAAHLERETAKKLKAEKDAIKSIYTPEGGPLKIEGGYGVIKSARVAQIEAVDIYVTNKAVAEGKTNGYYLRPEDVLKRERDFKTLVAALAHKFERSEEEQIKILAAKGDAKYKNEWK